MLWLLLLKPSVRVLLLQVSKNDNIELKGTPGDTGEPTSYCRCLLSRSTFKGE